MITCAVGLVVLEAAGEAVAVGVTGTAVVIVNGVADSSVGVSGKGVGEPVTDV